MNPTSSTSNFSGARVESGDAACNVLSHEVGARGVGPAGSRGDERRAPDCKPGAALLGHLTEAAEMLGFTRQHAFKKARQANEGHPNGWKSIRRVGSKPMYLISTTEIADLLADGMDPNGTE